METKAKCGHDGDPEHSCCHHQASNPSVYQTLDELDFDRGLWNAALYGDKEEVRKKMSQKHFDVDSCDKAGYTALHYASRNGHLDVCQLLLDNGAQVNVRTGSTGATPLHRAAYMGHTDIVSLLLAHGADTSIQDCDGKTALQKAEERGHDTTCQLLLQAQVSR